MKINETLKASREFVMLGKCVSTKGLKEQKQCFVFDNATKGKRRWLLLRADRANIDYHQRELGSQEK